MFCSSCGTEVPNDSMFCPNCGATIGEVTNTMPNKRDSLNLGDIGNFAILAIKDPITTCKELICTLSDKMLILYFVIVAILTSLISALTVNTYISDMLKKAMGLNYSFDSYANINQAALAQLKFIKSTVVPFESIFLWLLIGIVTFYLITIIAVSIVNNIFNKDNTHYSKYFITVSVALTIQLLSSIITFIASFISIYLVFFVTLITNIVIIIILYRGFNELINYNKYYVYIFALVLAVAVVVVTYIVSRMISSHLISLFTNSMLKDLFDPSDLFNLFDY